MVNVCVCPRACVSAHACARAHARPCVQDGMASAAPRLWPTEAPIVTRPWQLFCHSCDFADAIAVPIFIHKNDLKKLAPLWTAK